MKTLNTERDPTMTIEETPQTTQDRDDRRPGSSIGTLNERPLHAALKAWAAEEGDRFEVPVLGFVADIVRESTVIEIQTGSASGLRRKLSAFLPRHEVRVVLPVAARKTIVREDGEGREVERRTSPRRAHAVDAFRQLVSLGDLLGDSNLSIDIVLIHEEEVRRPAARHGRRRYSVGERRLAQVLDCVALRHPADYLGVLPASLADDFTTADLARAIRQPRWMAQKIAYVLRTMGLLRVVGKSGNAFVYRRAASA
jgi:hypothetical protein